MAKKYAARYCFFFCNMRGERVASSRIAKCEAVPAFKEAMSELRCSGPISMHKTIRFRGFYVWTRYKYAKGLVGRGGGSFLIAYLSESPQLKFAS